MNGLLRQAETVKRAGRKGDSELVHVNEREVKALEKATGNRGRNPKTGLREFWAEGSGDLAGSDPGQNAGVGGTGEGASTGGGYTLGSIAQMVGSMIGLDKKGDLTQAGTVSALGMMSGMPGMGMVANMAATQNEKQANDAMVAGNFNENGSLYGGGLAGEKVGISTESAGPIDPDTGKGGPGEGGGASGPETDLLGTTTPSPANYRTGGNGLLTGEQAPRQANRPGSTSYEFDPVQGRMVWKRARS